MPLLSSHSFLRAVRRRCRRRLARAENGGETSESGTVDNRVARREDVAARESSVVNRMAQVNNGDSYSNDVERRARWSVSEEFKVDGALAKRECAICLEALGDMPVVTAQCLHLHHAHCIRSWLNTAAGGGVCPVCRHPLVPRASEVAQRVMDDERMWRFPEPWVWEEEARFERALRALWSVDCMALAPLPSTFGALVMRDDALLMLAAHEWLGGGGGVDGVPYELLLDSVVA